MGRGGRAQTLMWEVRCLSGQGDAVVQWVRDEVVPGLWDDEDVVGYNAYSTPGGDEDGERVVVIVDYLGAAKAPLPELPEGLAARPPHAWVFSRLDL
jgi:hypothetical protein